MPSGFMALDQGLPNMEGEPKEQLLAIYNYLVMLLQELRYTLYNLGEENIGTQDWGKISNQVVFTALGEDGATIINGGNIQTGTIDAQKVNVDNIDARRIKVGELDSVNIRGVDIYGSAYHDNGGQGTLDILYNSQMSKYLFRLGIGDAADRNLAFSVRYDPIGGPVIVAITNKDALRASYDGAGITATGAWSFENDPVFPQGSQYPTATDVQNAISAALASYPTTQEVQDMIDAATGGGGGGGE